jgi:hypothetical protein
MGDNFNGRAGFKTTSLRSPGESPAVKSSIALRREERHFRARGGRNFPPIAHKIIADSGLDALLTVA